LVGRVDRTLAASGTLQVEYSCQVSGGAPSGRFAYDIGNVVRDFGVWPEPGDRLFLMVDPARPYRRAVWGFALPPGRPPRSAPDLHRPLPTKVVVVAVAGAVAIAAGLVAWIGLPN